MDPGVQTAFAVGWQVAELAQLDVERREAESSWQLLPQVMDLGVMERVKLLQLQIPCGVDAIGIPEEAPAGVAEWPMKDFRTHLKDTVENGTFRNDKVKDVHDDLLQSLTARDFRLGKAYSAGVTLGQTVLACYNAATRDDVRASFGRVVDQLLARESIDRLVGQIRDLKTSFQPLAADACAATLRDWQKWWEKQREVHGEELPPTLRAGVSVNLYYQGQLWRALLSGEKDPRDLLQAKDYVAAVGDMARSYLAIGRKLFTAARVTLLLGFAALVTALVFVLVEHVQQVWSFVVALLTVAGVGVAGAVAAVRSAVTQAGGHFWEAELAAAVAASLEKMPDEKPGSSVGQPGARSSAQVGVSG